MPSINLFKSFFLEACYNLVRYFIYVVIYLALIGSTRSMLASTPDNNLLEVRDGIYLGDASAAKVYSIASIVISML